MNFCWNWAVVFVFCWPTIDCSKQNGCEHSDESVTLKYSAELNINEETVQRWPNYVEQVQKAFHLYQNDLSQTESNSSSTCGIYLPLVTENLDYFENLFGTKFITKDVIDRMVSAKSGVHYQIVDHRLYRDKQCMFPSRCEGVEYFLLRLIQNLPNMDLVINVRDYPQVGKYFRVEQQFPVLSFSKDVSNYADIIYPAWTFWSGGPALDLYPTGIGRWDLMRESLLRRQSKTPWNQKKKVAFFRGSRTSSKRDPIVLLSRSRPDLVDAKYTKNQAWKSKDDTLGEDPAPTVSFEDHCQYKYLFNAQGVAASFRLKHLFLCQSLVLNVNSNWIEFFYPPLKPWFHYIPVEADFKGTTDLLEFLNENDQLASQIAKRGFEFIRDHLTMSMVECYWNHLLQSYSDRLISHRPIKADSGLIEIN